MPRYTFPTRDVIFGLEDGLVSTLGVVVGVAAGTDNRYAILLSGLVLIIVEALSMATGTYLSEKSELELDLAKDKKSFIKKLFHRHNSSQPLIDSLYMWVSYVLGGFIPLTAFFFFSPLNAIFPSILVTALSLYLVGAVKAKYAGINPVKSGLEMSLVSLAAAGVGFMIGKMIAGIFGHQVI